MIRVRLLGTGVPVPSSNRAGSCYLIETGTDVIMFDCGQGSFNRLLEAGLGPEDVSHLFFSHFHFDHCLDYPSIVMTRWDQVGGIKPDLKVYGPPPLLRINKLLFGDDGVFAGDIAARTGLTGSLGRYQARGGSLPRPRPAVSAREIGPEERVDIARHMQVTAIEAFHASPHLRCLSYRLDTPDGALVYSGDTTPNARLEQLAQGCEVLIHMCAYLEGAVDSVVRSTASSSHMDAARIAAKASAKKLVLTHMGDRLSGDHMRSRILDDISVVFSGEVLFADDLMELSYGVAHASVRGSDPVDFNKAVALAD